jgi:competence protein ComEA
MVPWPRDPHDWPRVILRMGDQAVVAAGVVLALALMAGWWGWRQWIGSGWIDIERAEPVAVKFEIDVNEADWPALAVMPNVGEQLAKRIVADRAKNGRYNSLTDLDRVRGIGPKTIESMRPYLRPLVGDGLNQPAGAH